MTSNVWHPGVHLWTYPRDENWVRNSAKLIKKTVFGSENAPTSYCGNGNIAQLAVQTEFRFADYVNDGEQIFLQRLDSTLNAFFREGIAVHLLLSVHGKPNGTWMGTDWSSETWGGATWHCPYKPDENNSPYDTIFEYFHVPVIKHIVDSGLAEKLSVIYILNEFDYDNEYISSENWPGANLSERKLHRKQALAYTTMRGLRSAREAAQSKVPVGVKFMSFNRTASAYYETLNDQLSYIIRDVMIPNGDVVGYDAYFGDSDYDKYNRNRLVSLIPNSANGQLEIAEYGHNCQGSPGNFTGSRTSPSEMKGIITSWNSSRGFNLFALNASGSPDGCYAIWNDDKIGTSQSPFYSGGDSELAGILDQIKQIVNSASPSPCN